MKKHVKTRAMLLIVAYVLIVAIFMMACESGASTRQTTASTEATEPEATATPVLPPTPSCINKIDGDTDGITAVSISVNHCDTGIILPQVGGITITNGKMKSLKISQRGKDDYMSPQSTKTYGNGEIHWKLIE